MAKRAMTWKENQVISVETRKGIFVLGQMLKFPYVRFYNEFRQDENWENIDLTKSNTLFVNGVTKQFLQLSNITAIKNVKPDEKRKDPDKWIEGIMGSRRIRVWEGTESEKNFIILGGEPGGILISRDITKGSDQDKKVLGRIQPNDDALIDSLEMTALGVYPLTNERLYLCYKHGSNVDPTKDLKFDRKLPTDYKVIVEIMAAASKEEQQRLIAQYFQ